MGMKEKIAEIHAHFSDEMQSLDSTQSLESLRVKVLGNICMDQCMVDLSGFSDVKIGEEVVLIGRQGEEFISADEVGERYHTIGYEVVCAVNRRVPRFFVKNNNVIFERNYLEK